MKFEQREIKFRVWDKSRGAFHWSCLSNICLSLGGRLMWQFGFKSPDLLDKEESKNYVLQQFTGLHDKNDKEIYEGDVIKGTKAKSYGGFIHPSESEEYIDVIKWKDSVRCGFNLMGCIAKSVEVIGNIFEDGGLLNVKNKG